MIIYVIYKMMDYEQTVYKGWIMIGFSMFRIQDGVDISIPSCLL